MAVHLCRKGDALFNVKGCHNVFKIVDEEGLSKLRLK